MLLGFLIAAVVWILCLELNLPLALVIIGFGLMLICAGLACTCPRKLKDDEIFHHHVL
jgi:high-affinity Fe2+/Pb2+ permease